MRRLDFIIIHDWADLSIVLLCSGMLLILLRIILEQISQVLSIGRLGTVWGLTEAGECRHGVASWRRPGKAEALRK